MFGFWFWALAPVALILVTFLYERRHDRVELDWSRVRNNETSPRPGEPDQG
jgi:hypothetical protein